MSVQPEVSAVIPDWEREALRAFTWNPPRALLGSIRLYQAHAGRRGAGASLMQLLSVLRHRFWSAVTGADIPVTSRIGGGLLIPHPNGIVIHPGAEIGPNCLIFQQVTLGVGARAGLPRVGGHVDIGAGAKILGGVVIGDHARIGANAVVLDDVPAGATAVGIPARVIARAGASA